MKRHWLTLWLALAAAPLAAQQVAPPAPRISVGTRLAPPVVAVPAPAPAMGPRAGTDWRPATPTFRREMMASSSSDSHTITLSTIALVLVVVILVLLIVR